MNGINHQKDKCDPIMKWVFVFLIFGMIESLTLADVSVSIFSGQVEGSHPSPVFVAPVKRGDRWAIEFTRGIAQVNFPDQVVIAERVVKFESGANVTCPWYIQLDGSPMGVRINESHVEKIDHKVDCSDGSCTGFLGKPIPPADLLFGRYHLPKCTIKSGGDYGFNANFFVDRRLIQICCPEFKVERVYSELHYFDQLLETQAQREQSIEDLDVDFKKIYLTFENSKGERSNCQLADLFKGGNEIQIDPLRDCVLPQGEQFMMYAQSRFLMKDTRPCGKFVARGQAQTDGSFQPDWFLGWYECDGKVDHSPIMKQFNYPTRIELKFIDLRIQGVGNFL